MIFKTLSLENFRVFNDIHEIELAPRKDGLLSKPVILFGGLNGAGKTSILTAIRLALLGRKAIGATLSKKDFHKYLVEQINAKAAKESENPITKVSLDFTHTHQGNHSIYRVERSWSRDTEEKLVLFKNNELEKSLTTEQVQSFLHELVPPGIGDLFFFDGEKIAELAEDDTGTYLKEAVQKLLGIDVINRLSDDLDIYIKQISQKASDTRTAKLIDELENQKKELLRSANLEREKEAQVKVELVHLERDIRSEEQKIQEKGGAWAKTKDDEKNRAGELIKRKTVLETKLLSELDGSFPISLAPKAMASLIDDLTLEQHAKDELAFQTKLSTNMEGLKTLLKSKLESGSEDILDTISDYFQSPIESKVTEIKLDISNTDFNIIQNQITEACDAKMHCKDFTTELKETEQALESLSVNIQRAPDEVELGRFYESLRTLDKQRHELKTQYNAHLTTARSRLAKALELAKRLEKLYVSQKTEASVATAIERVDSTNRLLDEFSQKLTKIRVAKLEELFSKSYRKLARKEDLEISAQIDPLTFDVTLVDSEGLAINRKSLSAGEKQIFAFAVLEALGKLSGKVLPVIVDTPLGRLDSRHRDRLVQHYFPEAGEQVILLSTDTEVDEDFFNALSTEVSHAFEIEFDEKTRCSTLKEGYFWKTKQKHKSEELV